MSVDKPAAWDELLQAAHVWYWNVGSNSERVLEQRFRHWLTEAEIASIENLRVDRLRNIRFAAKVLRNLTLSHYTAVPPANWRFVPGKHGKPEVAEPSALESVRFNLTHTDGLVACIISRAREVGIDGEETSREVDFAEIAPHFFSAGEQARIANSPPERRAARFFAQWVLKEAYFKACGTGIPESPERIALDWTVDDQPLALGDWQFALKWITERHVAAAAVQRAGRTADGHSLVRCPGASRSWRRRRTLTDPTRGAGPIPRRSPDRRHGSKTARRIA